MHCKTNCISANSRSLLARGNNGKATATVYDAIVVGSGAAGSFAAKELTERGLRVLLLEAGRPIDPAADFPLPPRRDRGYTGRVLRSLVCQPIQARSPAWSSRTQDFYVNDRQNPYTTPKGQPFNWFRGRQLGGRLHVWARLALRFSDLEFKAASQDGFGANWPICYADLEPYYDRVEKFLGLLGSRDRIPHLPDGEYAGSNEPTLLEQRFKHEVETKVPGRRVISARVVQHNADRLPLPLLAAQRTGKLTVRTDSIVAQVTIDRANGRATGVLVVDSRTGTTEEVKGCVVVLCASTIETLRIMLNSRSPQYPAGIGNSSGNLGRYLMDHTMIHCRGSIGSKDWDPSYEAARDPYDFGKTNGFYIPRYRNVSGRHHGYLRGFGIHGAAGRHKAGWHMLAIGECLAQFENRVTLDAHKTDAWGIPAARIEFSRSANEVAMVDDQKTAFQELAEAAGLEIAPMGSKGFVERTLFQLLKGRLLDGSGALLPGSSIHELGGAGMGDDPKRFVLSGYNQCWDTPNVFVTDGACFVSAGCQNPTLTIMALTVRACDYIACQLHSGEL